MVCDGKAWKDNSLKACACKGMACKGNELEDNAFREYVSMVMAS
jgi:hypothetical protein